MSLIAGLAIVGQVLVQRSLSSQRNGGHVVNEAGYQRMLSQRIALKLVAAPATRRDERDWLHDLEAMRDRWLGAHTRLEQEADSMGYAVGSQVALRTLLDDVHRPMLRIGSLVDKVSRGDALDEADRQALLADQEVFLPLMDAVVRGFEQGYEERVAGVQRIEMGLLLFTLLVLALEAALIFRPAVQRLRVSLRQLEQRNKQVANRLDSLRHLAGGIAHNFNNLLTAITGNAELQRQDAMLERQNTELIDAQIESCRRAAGIVAELLKYSGHGLFDRQPTALVDWLGGLEQELGSRGVAVQVVIELGRDATADIDRAAFAQAIVGIVANATEAMEGRAGRVTVRLHRVDFDRPQAMSGPYRIELPPGSYACIRVTDQGVGMQPEDLEGMFDPYRTQRAFGRGLGLAAILGIAHGHGGGIEVDSRPGGGTTVALHVPLTADKRRLARVS